MRNTDKTEILIYTITDVSYNTFDTVHMIQLQQSTQEVTYTSTLTYIIYMNTYLPIQFYRLLQMTTTTPKDMKELHSSSSNPKQNIYNLKYSV